MNNKSWKTTVIGIVLAAVNLWLGGADWKHVVASVLIAAAGAVAKDADVTGAAP